MDNIAFVDFENDAKTQSKTARHDKYVEDFTMMGASDQEKLLKLLKYESVKGKLPYIEDKQLFKIAKRATMFKNKLKLYDELAIIFANK